MEHGEMLIKIIELQFDTEEVVCEDGGIEVFIFRPSKLSKRFRNYDLEKNFQIWLREGERKFRPNHLRVMIDLNLRTRCRPDLKKELLNIFDEIFYGADPDEVIVKIGNENFQHFLNPIRIIANLHQLFIIEQEYCYDKESNYDPLTLFYQGWVRQMIDSPKEIDNLCMSVCNRQPPNVKYTCKEDAKHKKYQQNRKILWYLENKKD